MSLWKRASCSASAAIWYASSLVGLMMRMVIWPEAGGRCLSCRAAGIHSKSVQQSCSRHSSPVTPVRSAVMFTYGYCRQSDGGTHVEISETQVPLQVDSCTTLTRLEKQRLTISIAGIRKARVLPVPVLALQTTSTPDRHTGREAAWTLVQVS